eukprot:4481348-Pyramimonas_sp.AAC.1
MAIQIKGEGKEADRDLYHFYDEWVRVTLEMGKPHKSFRPSIQSYFYRQMKKCPCMAMTLAMYGNSDEKCGKGMKSHEWLLGRIGNQMLKDQGEDSRRIQKQQINKRWGKTQWRADWWGEQGLPYHARWGAQGVRHLPTLAKGAMSPEPTRLHVPAPQEGCARIPAEKR